MSQTQKVAATPEPRGAIHLQAGLVLIVGATAAALFGGGSSEVPAAPSDSQSALVRRAAPLPPPVEAPTTQLLGYVDEAKESTEVQSSWGTAAQPRQRTAARVDVAAWTEAAPAVLANPLYMAAAAPPPRATMRPFAPAPQAGDGMTPVGAGPRKHVVRDGDTLGGLAEKYYGDARRYRELFAANRDVLSSPELLPIGVTLQIPSFDPTVRPAIPPPTGARLLPQVLLRGP